MAVAVEQRRKLARIMEGRSWIDLLVLAWLWWGFDKINNLGGEVRQHLAERHGHDVLHLERALHAAPELGLNTWLVAHHVLRQIVVAWYEDVHGVVTFVVLGVLWWRRSASLPALRLAIVATNLVGLAVFWTWPVAPLRMLHAGFVDLVDLVHGGNGRWPAGAISLDPEQLSALPSLHLAWAVWSSIAVWRMTRRRWLRSLAVVYPFITVYAVMATANHYLADCVLGAGVMALAVLAADRITGRRGGQALSGANSGARRSTKL